LECPLCGKPCNNLRGIQAHLRISHHMTLDEMLAKCMTEI